MDCSEIRDLLPDYHLGNLSPDESEMVSRHISKHRDCAEESESVARTLGLLAFGVEPARPQAGAKERLMQRIGREDQGVSFDDQGARFRSGAIGRTSSERARPPRSSWTSSPRTTVLLLAAVVVLALSLSVLATLYNGLRQTNEELQARASSLAGGTELVVLSAGGTELAPDARAMLVMEPVEVEGDRDRLALGVYGMPNLADDEEYRVWAVDDSGAYEPLGVMETNSGGDGQMQGEMPESDGEFREIEITADGPRDGHGPAYVQLDLGGE